MPLWCKSVTRFCHVLECLLGLPSSSVTGERILQAINDLSDLIRNPGNGQTPSWRYIGQDELSHRASHDYVMGTLSSPANARINGSGDGGETTPRVLPGPSTNIPLQTVGLETVLNWEPLSAFEIPRFTFGDHIHPPPPSNQIPNIEYQELSRLEAKYVVGVHLKNPILDLSDLHRKILMISENGLDWSTQTCLVTLVCAIGALTQRYLDPGNVCVTTPSPGIVRSSIGYEGDTELSIQFWGIAARRLGFAISQNNVEAVQCLCLAG